MALPSLIPEIAEQVAHIPGMLGVALGGSHATGTATPASDIDLSLAYDGQQGFDLAALNALCQRLDDTHAASASDIGGWGPWVDGGAWLTVQGQRVDFIYRDLKRVQQSVQDALAGQVALFAQPGHPHGIHAHHYAAELASCVILHDETGQLAALKGQIARYPPALAQALQHHYGWQKNFWLDSAEKGLKRGDMHYTQGSMYQAVMALVQERAARQGIWLLNEKGSLARTCDPELSGKIQAAILAQDIPALRTLMRQVGPSVW